MTRRCFSHFGPALAGLLLAPVLARAGITGPALANSEILEGNVVYLRVSQVAAVLPAEISAADRALAATNRIAGTILDLRFADGDDAAAATATANGFSAQKLPLAILVNGKTRGAAVTLATTLRESRAGLIFGGPAAAVKPDIAVEVSPGDEKKFVENPYTLVATNQVAALSDTNELMPFVDHTSEADLVRAKIKDGEEGESLPPADGLHLVSGSSPPATEPLRPIIRDPVLARAVDLIKGLAIVRRIHS